MSGTDEVPGGASPAGGDGAEAPRGQGPVRGSSPRTGPVRTQPAKGQPAGSSPAKGQPGKGQPGKGQGGKGQGGKGQAGKGSTPRTGPVAVQAPRTGPVTVEPAGAAPAETAVSGTAAAEAVQPARVTAPAATVPPVTAPPVTVPPVTAPPVTAEPAVPPSPPAAASSAVAAAPAPEAASGRQRLLASLVPRATRAQLLAGLLCLLLGLALAVQVRSNDEEDLSSLRQADLVGLLDDASDRSERLEREIADLERTREELLSSGDQRAAARDLAQERVDALGVLAGTAAATGPGIRLVVSGPGVDDLVLLSAVQELRDAGAEAIQVGDVRVVAETAFVDGPDGAVEVDGEPLEGPYTFLAIGDPQTLSSAMDFPGGVAPTVRLRGGTASVEQLDEVQVTALRVPNEPQYAQPVAPSPDPTSP